MLGLLKPALASVLLFAGLTSAEAAGAAEAYSAALEAIGHRLDPGARTLDRCVEDSGQIDTHFPGYDGLPVKRCIYKEGALLGLAYTLHPTREQMAGWIAHACSRLAHAPQKQCAAGLFDKIWQSNGAQYIVAGNVIEPGDASGCSQDETLYNIQFRDGVTVALPNGGGYRMCWPGQRSIAQQEADRSEGNTLFYFVARVAALDLDDYQRLSHQRVATTSRRHSKNDPRFHPTREWGELSRKSYVDAMRTGNYGFLDLQAELLYPQ